MKPIIFRTDRVRKLSLSLLCCAFTFTAEAQESPASHILSLLPSESALNAYKKAMEDQPENLDNYFSYAQMAMKLEQFDRAAWALEKMLALNPQLERVKLDLGLCYSRIGKYDEAKRILLEVKAKPEVPQPVRDNIDFVLKQIDVASQTHFWSGSVSTGVNYDTNGNSASASGRITVFDTSIPLSPAQQAKKDAQAFATASVTHRYQPHEPLMDGVHYAWESTGSIYGSEQDRIDSLNLRILSLQTGPQLYVDDWATKFSLNESFTDVTLAGHNYLRNYGTKLGAEYQVTQAFQLNGFLLHEYRDFINTAAVSTYADRTGYADEANIGFGYMASPQDYIDGSISFRHEDTKKTYYDNDQISPSLGYTHQFADGYFFRADGQYRLSDYAGPDDFISVRSRKDYERTGNITVGKQLGENVVITLGYQRKEINSSIENYQFENGRYATTLSVRF